MTQNILSQITHFYRQLRTAKNLAPSQSVNKLFSGLVSIVQQYDSSTYENVVEQHNLHSVARDLQDLCGKGEYALEMTYAKKIIQSSKPRKTLENFPYLKNYEELIELELSTLDDTPPPAQALFIGSGPLPLSAILMVEKRQWQVDCMDREYVACDIGQQVVQALDVPGINFLHTDIHNYKNLKPYQFIILGALVGNDSAEKEAVLNHINRYSTPGTKILIRSSHGLREFLYPPIKHTSLVNWQIKKTIHPKNDIINSIILLCKT